ncbi:phage tail tip lysozyme [Secundilactobacillus collinoides]|uniref:phage tail tip lysozyme n=1 Tax=Secundilactobacillus collinoides TaxID=33960 RepID=UPI0006D0DDAB|nr:phage tail tip lysozyme [Secundilactobacillus collinoides]
MKKNGGKGREAAISATNRAVSKLLTNNTNKETIIYGRLKDRTSKLSQQQARSIIRSSYKTMKSTVSSANKTYKSAKSAANKKYNSVRNAADKEYYVTHSISKKQHDKIISNARSQRDKTISAARTTKNKTIDNAETMHEKVVQKTSAMVKGNLKQMNTWTGKIKGIWGHFGNWWGNLWGGLTKLGHLGTKAMASDLTNGLKQNNSLLTQMKNGKKNPSKSKRTASKDANKLPGNVFAAHALGTSGAEMHSHAALVGEGGTELAYTVNGRKARLLGANGPEIAHVKHGERILNHRDTKKVLSGSYGNVLPGYAAGNMKLGSSNSLKSVEKLSKKTVKDYKNLSNGSSKQLDKFSKSSKSKWSNIHKATSKITHSTQKKTVTDYDQLQKGSYKQLVQFDKGNTSKWRNINSDTKHYTNQSKNQAISTYDSMQKGVQKQVNQMQSGVISSGKATATGFGHALGKMDNYAHSAMSNTVQQLNGGIKGIDKVLGQFGGNSSVINAIHYAKGSNGELSNDQLAIVNDAKSGPRQESIIRNNSLLIPHGNDRMIPLKKRDRVLNGSQTQELGRSMGIQHFAKGSGISHTELNKIISKNNAHPNRAFTNEFSSNISKSNTVLGNAIKGLSKLSTTKYGNPWSAEVWRQMDNARGDGGGAYGSGTWLHSPGSGFHDTSGMGYRGAVSGGLSIHDGNDFSGAHIIHAVHPGKVIRSGGAPRGWGGPIGIGQNMVTKSADGYYVIYQEFNGKNNSGAHTFVSVGDDVKAGQRIAALGPAGTHVHIGVSKRNPFSNNPDSTSGWFDVTKMKSTKAKKSSKESHKASSVLSKLVAKEIAPQLKWVGKHLKRSAGSIGSLGVSGSIESRAKTLYNAIKKAYPSATKKGIEAVLGNWKFESHLDPGISNSAGALGLGQWLDRGPALRRYAAQHHMSWKNAGAQIDFALHGDGANSAILKRVLRGNGSVSSLAAEFSNLWERGGHTQDHVNGAREIQAALHNNGGWSTKGKLNVYGEKDPEIAINPKKPNADNLIGSAISARSKTSNSVFSNESQKKMHKALLENLRKYNPLKGLSSHSNSTTKAHNNVTVNLNMNITVNANDKNAGTKVANDISKQVNEQVQAIFGNLMAKREGGFI